MCISAIFSPVINSLNCLPEMEKNFPRLLLRNSSLSVVVVVAHFFQSPLASSFVYGTCAQLLTVVVIAVIEKFDGKVIVHLSYRLLRFKKDYPRIQLVLFIAIFVTRFFFIFPTLILGSLLGFYSGLMSSLYYYKVQQSNSPTKPTKHVMHGL